MEDMQFLLALLFTPDIFACGVDIVGPSNLLTLINKVFVW